METYMIRRRRAWQSPEELEETAKRSGEVAGEEFPQDIAWIRSYVVEEDDGTLGTFCVYQASSEGKVREHASRVGMPAHDIDRIVDTVVIRPDPEPAAAA